MSGFSLEFKPIDLDKHAHLCIEFAEDSYRLTFGKDAVFEETTGYIERMREKLAADPTSCLFAWRDGQIVGQINFGQYIDPSIAYLSVLYVVSEWRGTGVAGEIEQYACDRWRAAGFAEAMLSVGWANKRAIAFYEKCGWVDLGARDDRPHLHNMRKSL